MIIVGAACSVPPGDVGLMAALQDRAGQRRRLRGDGQDLAAARVPRAEQRAPRGRSPPARAIDPHLKATLVGMVAAVIARLGAYFTIRQINSLPRSAK